MSSPSTPSIATRRFLALALAFTLPLFTSAQTLQTKIDRAIADRNIERASVAVMITDLQTGSELASYNPDIPMIPASNQKLLTTAAALAVLGPEARLTTELLVSGNSLVIRGNGDPAFGDSKVLSKFGIEDTPEKRNIDKLIDRWVENVREQGLTSIDTLYVDDRVFDDQRVHPNWPTNQLHRWYCAQVAAINFNDNCIDVYATPRTDRPGLPPAIAIVPEIAPVSIDNRATSVKSRQSNFGAARQIGTNNMVFTGNLSYTLTKPVNITVDDPAMFFARTLRNRLESNGILVGRVERVAPDDDSLDSARPIAIVQTMLAEILNRCNTDSQNLFAEALIKHLGHRLTGEPGSWQNGAASVRLFMTDAIGTEAASVSIDDGSGMSRENRVSPRTITRLLDFMDERPELATIYRESLARPGYGTLDERFVVRRGGRVLTDEQGEPRSTLNGRIYAKSGYINNVITLSGYLIGEDGSRVAFSVMLNGWTRSVWEGRELINEVVEILDDELTASKPAENAFGG